MYLHSLMYRVFLINKKRDKSIPKVNSIYANIRLSDPRRTVWVL
jgi:hypothetical protein